MFWVSLFVRRLSLVIGWGLAAWTLVAPAKADPPVENDTMAERYIAILLGNPGNESALERATELVGPKAVVASLESQPRTPNGLLALARARLAAGDRAGALKDLAEIDRKHFDARGLALLGRLLFEAGDPDEANSAWSAMGEDPETLRLAVEAMLSAGAGSSAIPLLEKLQNHGNTSSRIEWMELLAKTLSRVGDETRAAAQWEMLASRLDPSHWRWLEIVQQANASAFSIGQLDALDGRLKSGTSDMATLRWRAEIARLRGDTDSQLRLLSDALRLAPQDDDTRRALIESAFAAGRHGEVEPMVTAWASSDPRAGIPLLAEILVMTSRDKEATGLIQARVADREDRLDLLKKWNLREGILAELTAATQANPYDLDPAFALAGHLLADAKFREAENVFERFSNSDGKTRIRIAAFLRDRQCLLAAERWARSAGDLEPIESALLLADLLQSRGDLPAAKEALLKAATDPLPDESLDRRLYELLRVIGAKDGESVCGAETKAFAAGLAVAASRKPSTASWWRAARWSSWNGDIATAIDQLRKAAAISPDSPNLARRLAAELERDGRYEEAIATLESIQDPSADESASDRRARARLLVLIGDPEAAIADLTSLRENRPADWETARELALARQAAGNFFGALETWLAADAAAPSDRRPELLRPLLSCFSRLGAARKGLDFLAARIASLPPGHEREELIHAAGIFAADNQLDASWLGGGNSTAATATPRKSPAIARSALLEEFNLARREKKSAAAKNLAAKLAALPDASLDDDLRLAESCSNSPDAEDTWRKLASRHPRDAKAQRLAGDFFSSIGKPIDAIGFWQRASELGGGSPSLSLAMAKAALKAGDRPAAWDAFLDTLHRTPPAPADFPTALPASLAGRTIETLPPSSMARWRLEAIVGLGTMLTESPRRDEAIESLPVDSPTEKAWLLAASGQPAQAADCLMKEANPEDHEASLAALLVAASDPLRLIDWANKQPAIRWSMVVKSAGMLVEAGWHPPEDLQEWVAGSPPFVRWQIAEILARGGWLRTAVNIAQPETLAESDQPSAFFRLAGWQLALRKMDDARKSLSRVISNGHAAPSWDSASASALRALLLLSPENARFTVVASARDATARSSDPAAMPHLETLLAALQRDPRAVAHHAPQLVRAWNSRGTAAGEAALREGLRLESWDLTAEARELYRAALANPAPDPRDALKLQRSLRDAIALTRISEETSPPAAVAFLQDWEARGTHRRQLLAAASRTHAIGNPRLAISLQESLFDPMEEASWQNLTAWSTPNLPSPLAPLKWIENAKPADREMAPPGWLARYASLLANHGHFDEAAKFLKLCPAGPEKDAANSHLDALLEGRALPVAQESLSGRSPDISLAEWKLRDARGIAEPADSLLFATALWKAGERAEALEIAGAMHELAAVDPAIYYSLARFHLAVNRPDRAAALISNPSIPARIQSRFGPLYAALSRQFLERGRLEEALTQVERGASLAHGVDPSAAAAILIGLHGPDGFLPALDRLKMGNADHRGTLLAASRQLLNSAHPAGAIRLLSLDPILAASQEARMLARSCPPGPEFTAYWNVVASSPIHAARSEAEAILARNASVSKTEAAP
ncbi:MAG: hypothetical protein Fur0032_12920 [Terrimicrobiaceae bacterium]